MKSQGQGGGLWLAGVVVVLVVLYYATVLSFYNIFSDEGAGQSHAPLLLAVSIYLLYREWDRGGRRIGLHINYLAIVLLAVFSICWMLLGLVFIEAGQQAVLVVILAVTVIAMLGLGQGMRYLMPILLLLTIVPLYSPVVPYLQTASAISSALVLDTLGMTSTREGYLLIIPNGTFEVADACSGLNFQIVGITLALIHTQLLRVPARAAFTYVVLSSILAFLSNVVRIVIVVIIGYFYGMENEYVQDHNFIGWILFTIFFFVFLFLGDRKFRHYESTKRRAADVDLDSEPVDSKPWVLGVTAVLLALSIGPVTHYYFVNQQPLATPSQLSVLHDLTGWRQLSSSLTEWAPIWTEGSESFEGSFVQDGESVDLFATVFNRQRQGNEAVNATHRVYDIEKWSRISRSARVVEALGRGNVEIEETLLRSPGQKRRIVWQWYRTNNKIVFSPMQAKLNNLIGVIRGEPDIEVFVLSREVIRDENHARGILEKFFKSYLSNRGDFS